MMVKIPFIITVIFLASGAMAFGDDLITFEIGVEKFADHANLQRIDRCELYISCHDRDANGSHAWIQTLLFDYRTSRMVAKVHGLKI